MFSESLVYIWEYVETQYFFFELFLFCLGWVLLVNYSMLIIGGFYMRGIYKLDLLLSIYVAAVVAAELLGSKVFTVGGWVNASVAIFVFPLTFTINDVVAEVYGKERVRSFIKSAGIVLVALAVYTALALVLPPAKRFVPDNGAYTQVFGKSLRIIVASLTAFWLAERFDVYVFAKIRESLGKKRLWLRNNASNFLGQLFDTTLFMFLAFWRPGNTWFILSLIWPYWLLKCGMSVVQTPLTYLGVKWLGEDKPKNPKL